MKKILRIAVVLLFASLCVFFLMIASTPTTPVSAASSLVNSMRSLKSAIMLSLIDGKELPLGSFSSDSPVISDHILPYADRSFPDTTILISADIPDVTFFSRYADPKSKNYALELTHLPSDLPVSVDNIYFGFSKHELLERQKWLELKNALKKKIGRYARPTTRERLVDWARERATDSTSALYKNAKGDLYDGGDIILMRLH